VVFKSRQPSDRSKNPIFGIVCKQLSSHSLSYKAIDSVVATGIAVLAGVTRITEPFAHFCDPFEGSTTNLNSLSVALVKVNNTFIGWHNAFYVLGEVKGTNPVRTVRKAGFISLTVVAFLYFFTNIAYVAAIPREEIQSSGQLVAALFFRYTFGDTWLARLLPVMVAMSCLGNIVCHYHSD
jgi:amino acid transporter